MVCLLILWRIAHAASPPKLPAGGIFTVTAQQHQTCMRLCRDRLRIVLQPSTARHKFRLCTEFTTVRPATAVRSSSRPALLIGQHLTGWKGLAVPYEGPGKGHFFTIQAEDYASRRCWFAFVAAGRRIRRGRPRGRPATR